MLVQRSAVGIEVQAPAKLNLFLEVIGRRDDGFHEIETLMTPISLYDTLLFRDLGQSADEAEEDQVRFTFHWANPSAAGNAKPLPAGRDNIVVRAVELVRETAGIDRRAEVRLIKRIPSEAGLGGASADAAAALLAANLGWDLGLSRSELFALAAQLGSDVPFFLHHGPAICRGRGEIVRQAPPLGDFFAVLVKPSAGLATGDVYRACRVPQRPDRFEDRWQAAGGTMEQAAGSQRIARLFLNRLEGAAVELAPQLLQIKKEFSQLDFLAHQMTGSGTSYFGICRSHLHARRLARRLAARGMDSVYLVRRAA